MKSLVRSLHISRFLQTYDVAAFQGIKLSIYFDFHKYASIARPLQSRARHTQISRSGMAPRTIANIGKTNVERQQKKLVSATMPLAFTKRK